MKLKTGFVVRKIVNDTVLMNMEDTSRLLRLNETAADMLAHLTAGLNEAEIVSKIVETYSVDAETAAKDVRTTLNQLRELGAIEE